MPAASTNVATSAPIQGTLLLGQRCPTRIVESSPCAIMRFTVDIETQSQSAASLSERNGGVSPGLRDRRVPWHRFRVDQARCCGRRGTNISLAIVPLRSSRYPQHADLTVCAEYLCAHGAVSKDSMLAVV
jgi:hypothetical protein